MLLFPKPSLHGLPSPTIISQQSRLASFLSRVAAKTIGEVVEKPRGKVSSYSLFYSEKFPQFQKEFPSFRIPDIAKRIGSQWQSLGEGEKKRLSNRAAELNKQAQPALDAYKKGLTEKQQLAIRLLRLNVQYRRGQISRRQLKPEEKAFLDALPKSPFTSGRAMFISQKLRGKPDVTVQMASVANEWNQLTNDQKSAYEKQALHDMKNYRAAITKFLVS